MNKDWLKLRSFSFARDISYDIKLLCNPMPFSVHGLTSAQGRWYQFVCAGYGCPLCREFTESVISRWITIIQLRDSEIQPLIMSRLLCEKINEYQSFHPIIVRKVGRGLGTRYIVVSSERNFAIINSPLPDINMMITPLTLEQLEWVIVELRDSSGSKPAYKPVLEKGSFVSYLEL